MKYYKGTWPALELRAFVDLEGKIPAKIGDPVALIVCSDLPFLVQHTVCRPVLGDGIEVYQGHVVMTGDGVDDCMELVGKKEPRHD